MCKDVETVDSAVEAPLSYLAKNSVNSHRYYSEDSTDIASNVIISDVAEILSAKQSSLIVEKFMELLTISGV